MISIPSISATAFRRLLPMAWVLLLAPGAVCPAQQSTSPDTTTRSARLGAQQKPLQIVRPMERQQAPWRGVPWMGDASQTAISDAAVPEQLALPAKQALQKSPMDGDHPIRVSGWWTIDVKNPDGSIASHREVENTYNLNYMIVYLLAGNAVAGEAAIQFSADGAALTYGPCGYGSGCLISEQPGGYWNSLPQCSELPWSCSTSLVPTVTSVSYALQYDSNGVVTFTAPALELNGQITAVGNSYVSYLETDWTYCGTSPTSGTPTPTSFTSGPCMANTLGSVVPVKMTYLTLAHPIAVGTGQIVIVQFALSFAPYED